MRCSLRPPYGGLRPAYHKPARGLTLDPVAPKGLTRASPGAGNRNSDAAALGWAAAVMRDRRDVADRFDLDAGGGQGADRRLAAGTRTGDADIDDTQARNLFGF